MAATTTAAVAHRDEFAEIDLAAVAATENARRCPFEAPALTCETVRGDLAGINTIVVRYEQYGDLDSQRCSHASRPELDSNTGHDGAHHTAVGRPITPNAHVGRNRYREDSCFIGSVDYRAACLHRARERLICHDHHGTVDDPRDRAWSAWRDPPSAPTRTVFGGHDPSIRLVEREPGR